MFEGSVCWNVCDCGFCRKLFEQRSEFNSELWLEQRFIRIIYYYCYIGDQN